jgi:small subunit ribosomal protein S18
MKTKKDVRPKITAKKRGKKCPYCLAKNVPVWQDYEKMKEFLSPRGRIISSIMSGVCVRHQRGLARAIKQARHLALLPFTSQE